jgi:hypothetical protein
LRIHLLGAGNLLFGLFLSASSGGGSQGAGGDQKNSDAAVHKRNSFQ